jgi:hydrogenase-4 component F
MNPSLLIFIPLAGAGLAAIWPDNRTRPWILPVVAFAHVVMSFFWMINPPVVAPGAWIGFDPLARALLPAVSLLFFICSIYAVPYLRIREERPNRAFVSLLLIILGLLSAGHQSRHLGILWITTEAVTLATVPLLHFNGTPKALEATWKYLLVGGTGIALSLLGSFCLGYASLYGGGGGDLTFNALAGQGAALSRPWVLIAWVLILVGYGTKMGLAPMHTWKPDAYGEAPVLVGAILAGGVTTVAFAAILRVRCVVDAAGAGDVANLTLLSIGIFSMVVAALFLLGTPDFKRMLAYSSVEHMGILCVGAGLGSLGITAALFHVWSNSLTKGSMFLSAGNIRRAAGSSRMEDVSGMSVIAPQSATLFIVGMFAITACPPFAPFFSELQVIRASLGAWHGAVTFIFAACLLLAFCGMMRVVFGVAYGKPHVATSTCGKTFIETSGVIVPPLLLLILSLWLGLFTPELLRESWATATIQLFPTP